MKKYRRYVRTCSFLFLVCLPWWWEQCVSLKRQYLSGSLHVVTSRKRAIVEYVAVSFFFFGGVSKKSKRFTIQMQSIFWCTVVTICTTWFTIPRLRIFPTHFICLSLGILKQRMDFLLKIQWLAAVLEIECLLWGTNWVFIYYLEEIRVSKTINWKMLRMVTQIKIGWGTRPEDLTLHSFMSLAVSVC